MSEKHTDKKLYRVIRKDGSHLNIKVNLDGTKSALQFTDDNNDLNGSVDLLEVDEEELIRFEYISVPQADRSIEDLLMKFLFLWLEMQPLSYLSMELKNGNMVEKKAVPVAKSQIVHIFNKGFW